MKSIHVYALASVIFAILVSACTQKTNNESLSHTQDSTQLVITGSSTLAPLISEIARSYEQIHENAKIDVQAGGSSRGMSDIKLGTADIGMVSKHVDSTQQITAHIVARDGVTIIVHKDNPIQSLDKKLITDIYQKRITKWSELGIEKPEEIVIISKAEGRSTLSVFLDYLKLPNSALKPDIIIGDNEQAIKLVSNNPNAIAYVSTSTAQYNIDQGVPIRSLQIDEVLPLESNIANGSFPIVRSLNLVSKPVNDAKVDEFIDFVTHSDEAKRLIKEFKFVPAS